MEWLPQLAMAGRRRLNGAGGGVSRRCWVGCGSVLPQRCWVQQRWAQRRWRTPTLALRRRVRVLLCNRRNRRWVRQPLPPAPSNDRQPRRPSHGWAAPQRARRRLQRGSPRPARAVNVETLSVPRHCRRHLMFGCVLKRRRQPRPVRAVNVETLSVPRHCRRHLMFGCVLKRRRQPRPARVVSAAIPAGLQISAAGR